MYKIFFEFFRIFCVLLLLLNNDLVFAAEAPSVGNDELLQDNSTQNNKATSKQDNPEKAIDSIIESYKSTVAEEQESIVKQNEKNPKVDNVVKKVKPTQEQASKDGEQVVIATKSKSFLASFWNTIIFWNGSDKNSAEQLAIAPAKEEVKNTNDDTKIKKGGIHSTKVEDSPNLHNEYIVSDKNKSISEYLALIESQNADFLLNKMIDYYGIKIAILKIEVNRDYSGDVINLKQEGTDDNYKFLNYKEEPDYYLKLATDYHTNIFSYAVDLYKTHQSLLRNMLSQLPTNDKGVIIMYSRGGLLGDAHDDSMKLERTVYEQLITNYLYKAKKKLRVVKRYIKNIPEDEVLLIYAKYQGSIPPNIYNMDKGDIIQWLVKYETFQDKRRSIEEKSKNDFEKFISTTQDQDLKKLTNVITTTVKKETPQIEVDSNIVERDPIESLR